MNQDFNNFSQFEPPVLILCTPNRDELYTLPLAYSIKNTLRYNALSELTFSYPKSKDGNVTTDSAYDYIQGKMVVYIPNNGYYIIQSCPEDNNGAVLIKNVTCYSLESEFLNFRVVGIKGTYDFLSLLIKIVSYKPTWNIGDVDEELYNLYRTFDETNTTGYNFMMVDMEKAFGCIFEFNTLTREVSAVLNTISPSSQSDIYLSFDNLIKKVEYKEISEEICTSMYCYGGNNLDIRDVNPLGTNNIYNFDYFKTTQWMSQELIDALDAWETKRDGYLTTFGDNMVTYNSLDIQKINYTSERTDLIGKLKSVIVTKEARLELDPTASTTDLDTQIEDYQYSIKSLEVSIQSVQNNMNTINSELREIVHDLYFTSKISYNNIRIDFFNILRSIEIIYSTFEDTYNENSDYPGFSIGLLTSLKPTILTAGEQAIEMATSLYSTFSATFPTYPPDETSYIIPITEDINSLIDYLETMNSSFQSLIPVTNINTTLYDIISKLHSYLNIISYSGNMTEDQYIELSPYIYENTYTNENIVAPTTENILGDNISIPDQIRIQSRALYDQSVNVLDKVSEPRYEFSGDFSNFVTVDDFSDFTSDLELGEIITVQKDDGTVIYAVLLELGISYDNPNDFSMIFSNRFRLATPGFIYTDVLGDATILGNSSSASGGITQGSVGGWGVSPAGMSLGNSSISSKGYISFGDTPPTAYGNFHGAWFGYDGAPRVSLFSNINNYLQWDGSKLQIKSEKFSLDSYGKITASEVNLSGRITATSGAIGGWIIEDNQIYADDSGSKRVILDSEDRYISFGITPPTQYGNYEGGWFGYDTVAKLSLYSDADNYFQWDGSKLVLKGTNFNLDTSLGGTIAGWTIATGSLYSGSGTTRVGIDSGGTNPSFYAGSETPASAPFRITNEGDLHVTTGEVDGDFQSTSFSEGATGWRIQGDGHAEFNEISLRGNIQSVVFAQTKINTIAGQMYVSDGAVLILGVETVDTTLDVDWNSFQSGDVVCLTSTTSGDTEWMRIIDNGTAITGGYRYTVTRNINLGGFGTFLPGDAVIRHGSSNAFEAGSIYFGAYEGVFGIDQPVPPETSVIVYAFGSTPVQGLGGWLDLNGTRTQGPYFGVWRRYGSDHDEVQLVASFGNLDGFLYFTEEIYGIAIGDDNRHMVYTDENGLEIITSGGDTTINENGISTNALTASLNRVLVEDLTVQDTRCFISVSYLDAGTFDIILEGDSVLQIL